jgi:hypothetical protein
MRKIPYACIMLLLAGTAASEQIVYEGFDYAPGELNDSMGGGTGWADQQSWYQIGGVRGNLAITENSLLFSQQGSIGNRLTFSGYESEVTLARRLAKKMDTSIDAEIYFSMMIRREDMDMTSQKEYFTALNIKAGSRSILRIQFNSGRQMGVALNNTPSPTAYYQETQYENFSEFLLFGKLTTRKAGMDQLCATFFKMGEPIALNQWMFNIESDCDLSGDLLTITAPAPNTGSISFDEIRFGTTAAEVLP